MAKFSIQSKHNGCPIGGTWGAKASQSIPSVQSVVPWAPTLAPQAPQASRGSSSTFRPWRPGCQGLNSRLPSICVSPWAPTTGCTRVGTKDNPKSPQTPFQPLNLDPLGLGMHSIINKEALNTRNSPKSLQSQSFKFMT